MTLNEIIGIDNVIGYAKSYKNSQNILNVYTLRDHIIDIPDYIDGIQTNVIQIWQPHFMSINSIPKYKNQYNIDPTTYKRPLIGGIQITCANTGTLGCMFSDKQKDIIGITSNHIVANTNNPNISDIIHQPNRRPQSTIGYIKKFHKLTANMEHDIAIIKINSDHSGSTINSIGKPSGFAYPNINDKVKKSGKTTKVTKGIVQGIEGVFKIQYRDVIYIVNNIIVTTYMATHGDSGSILLNESNKIYGVTIGGSETITLHNHIHTLFDHYGKFSII